MKLSSRSYGDLTGLKIHKLTVLNLHHRKEKTGELFWNCVCDCGKTTIVKGSRLVGKQRQTKSCGKCKTYKGICGEYWCRLRNQARVRKLDFTIDKIYIWELINKQDFKCAISGIPITLPKNSPEYQSHVWTASLDRIDNSKGYIKGNVQWLHKDVNFMKHTFTKEDLLKLCLIIIKYNRYQI